MSKKNLNDIFKTYVLNMVFSEVICSASYGYPVTFFVMLIYAYLWNLSLNFIKQFKKFENYVFVLYFDTYYILIKNKFYFNVLFLYIFKIFHHF